MASGPWEAPTYYGVGKNLVHLEHVRNTYKLHCLSVSSTEVGIVSTL